MHAITHTQYTQNGTLQQESRLNLYLNVHDDKEKESKDKRVGRQSVVGFLVHAHFFLKVVGSFWSRKGVNEGNMLVHWICESLAPSYALINIRSPSCLACLLTILSHLADKSSQAFWWQRRADVSGCCVYVCVVVVMCVLYVGLCVCVGGFNGVR